MEATAKRNARRKMKQEMKRRSELSSERRESVTIRRGIYRNTIS